MTDESQSIVKAVLGPTNTGKTHYAIERMLGHASGVIGLPLRLLAREVYDRIVVKKGAKLCALVTGEEKIIPPTALYYVCTVEAMPTDKRFNFVAIDEVQLMANHERGHIFTDRVLHMRGLYETLFLGAETARVVLSALVPKIRFDHRERFSELRYAGATKLTRLPKRSVVVAFSAAEVYALAELLRRYRGGAAVVMGGLSPRTRNAQAELFQSGEVDFMVATDAVGMGLNLDTDHVAFAGLSKYDGRRRRMLSPMEAAQIAGRAGRFRNDGTFGITGNCPSFDDEMIRRIEAHDFDPLDYVEWRNSDLDCTTLKSLLESLHAPRPTKRLRRIKGADDEAALERLIAIPEIRAAMKTRAQVKQLWDICQIPDFRNLTIDTHVKLLQDIYRVLVDNGGTIPAEFMENRIKRCDNIHGEIEQISARLAHIRTWTYCATKTSWMKNGLNTPKHWEKTTREVEDRLSDALHEKLIARFVDRRTNRLLKGMSRNTIMSATIKDNGDVFVDDMLIGRLDGLTFIRDTSQSKLEASAIDAAARQSVAPEIDRRLTSLCGGTHAIFTLSDEGKIMWGDQAVGQIAPSGTVFSPDAKLIGAELGNENLRHLAEERMREYLRAEVKTHLEPLQKLKDIQTQDDISAEAKGFAFTLLENDGAIDRRHHVKALRALDQDPRRELRAIGVTFGHFNIYMNDLIRPKPARLLGLLIAFGAGGNGKPFMPFAGMTSLPNAGELDSTLYTNKALSLSGYRAAGPRIVRFDILNRLANQVRDAQRIFDETKKPGVQGGRFQIMQEMLALLGASYEEIRGVLESLNYVATTEPEPLTIPAPPPEPEPEPVSEPEPVPETKTEPSTHEDTPSEDSQPVETYTAPIPETETEASSDIPAETEPKEGTLTKLQIKRMKQRQLQIYQPRIIHEDGTVEETVNLEYWTRKNFGGQRKNNHGGFKKKRQSNRHQGHRHKTSSHGNYQSGYQAKAKPRKNALESSPFAALAALQKPAEDKANKDADSDTTDDSKNGNKD